MIVKDGLGKIANPLAIESLMPLIFSEESFDYKYLANDSRKAIKQIATKNSLKHIENWIDKIEKNYPLDRIDNREKGKDSFKQTISAQTLQEQVYNSENSLTLRLDSLQRLVKDSPKIAKNTLLKLLENREKEADFGAKMYTYLADLKIKTSLDTIQTRLKGVSQQWQDWRKKSNLLNESSSEENRKKLEEEKPLPIVSSFIYAQAIARLDSDEGIKLLEHPLAEARRGAWEGLALLADVDLVKKLDKIRENNKENPILHHAAFRAIDLSLIAIHAKVKEEDRKALDTYLNQLEKTGRRHTSKDLSKNDPVALRIEWTRDRIKEGLESIKRVECRAEHWFETEWPEEGCP